ncbi:MAG: SEC-C domain-containing protein [Bacilli bacterium]|nr:SEC-C domain-containing protein [Bacilli bacterium]
MILYISHNTIYTRLLLTCGSGKKYKQCCGK